ncbi:transcriptional activator protein acu-15 [Echria macrotheca]|uniref:Transcriptional activator protein acu-15 n=1 Tax=Echria macrotheca TaxID=438768 RepID=A0AAJ0B958_9PEZI|nr:transcriptional activator protein acu-15 [Echria macrotheca]
MSGPPPSPTSPTVSSSKSGIRVPPKPSIPGLPRPKRAQVSRACDWCRVHRVKCDTEQPCQNCRNRGAQCSTSGANEIRNLPHAFREIERLKNRIQELENELSRRNSGVSDAASLPQAVPEESPTGSALTVPALSDDEFWREDECGRRARSFGLYTGDGRIKQWFGPSSLFYFINRITTHLNRFLENTPADHTIHFSSTTKSFTAAPPSGSLPDVPVDQAMDMDSQAGGSGLYLNALQEEYFLGFFWQSYHCSLQIVDELSFRELYRSLWAESTNMKTRKPSALVDIILALCIQYDVALPLRQGPASTDTKDTAIAGRNYYQRCQSLLLSELECPTISTLQCHIFSVYYLCCASFQNMAHSTLALAVRTAHILGLHLDPPADLPRQERELRRRLWWTLYSLESKTCIKLGRPWAAPMADTTCTLPSDDHQLAIQSGSAVLAGGNVTWLTYTLQSTKLVLEVRNVYIAFYHELARIFSAPSAPACIYDSPPILESLAVFLQSRLASLQRWVTNVPPAMQCQRADGAGTPFSTTATDAAAPAPLAIEKFAPLWLQRQRVYLELLYHNLCIILYRPLITFSCSPHMTTSHSQTPTAEACARQCVGHAIALTRITRQALLETDILKGFHEGFQWQWNAAITLVGFHLAYPATAEGTAAREAVDVAIEVFEIFGRYFVVGSRAARVVRELAAQTDFLLGVSPSTANSVFDAGGGAGHGHGHGSSGMATTTTTTTTTTTSSSSAAASVVDSAAAAWESMVVDGDGLGGVVSVLGPQSEVSHGAKLQDLLSGTMDVAFSVDSFNSSEAFHGGNAFSFADSWVFTAEQEGRGGGGGGGWLDGLDSIPGGRV